ncbi:unnamed protein product [Rotaria sordida]|uniref:Uncharacterized protein n=1 Tax=Rotaria sordida TaxID=392033 RepID=A0A816A1E0_9BILA|nr:unnamed protein product [Rotaria sordida]CAF1592071.1 unnamed protein product [Rotaria sordida]
MPRNKISDDIERVVKYLLTKKYSYSVIKKELSEMNLNYQENTVSLVTFGKSYLQLIMSSYSSILTN